jgi:hypothetical protein
MIAAIDRLRRSWGGNRKNRSRRTRRRLSPNNSIRNNNGRTQQPEA